jgi:hypothetical protein
MNHWRASCCIVGPVRLPLCLLILAYSGAVARLAHAEPAASNGASLRTVLVTLTPAEPGSEVRLNPRHGQAPAVACQRPCTVSVRANADYELTLIDAHGRSSSRQSFSEPTSLVASPPNHPLLYTGIATLGLGMLLCTVSTSVGLYGGYKNLRGWSCTNDECGRVSPGVMRAAGTGFVVSLPMMLTGFVLMRANIGPSLSPQSSPPAPASAGRSTLGLSIQSKASFASLRVAF